MLTKKTVEGRSSTALLVSLSRRDWYVSDISSGGWRKAFPKSTHSIQRRAYEFPGGSNLAMVSLRNRSYDDVKLFMIRKKSVTGKVIWKTGEPVKDANVQCVKPDTSQTVLTDENGIFKIDITPYFKSTGNNYRFTAYYKKDEINYYGLSDWIQNDEHLTKNPIIITLQKGIDVQGIVMDQETNPIPNAEVSLLDLFSYKLNKTTSNEIGRFQFTNVFPASENSSNYPDFVLKAKKEVFADTQHWLTMPVSQEVIEHDLIMKPAAWIRGRVTDSEGRPLKGTMAHAYQFGENGVNTTTDDNGEYTFNNLIPGTYNIRFQYTDSTYLSGLLENIDTNSDWADITLDYAPKTIHVNLTINGDVDKTKYLAAVLYKKDSEGRIQRKNTVNLPLLSHQEFSIITFEPGLYDVWFHIPSCPFTTKEVLVDKDSDSIIEINHTVNVQEKFCTLQGTIIPIPDYQCISVEIPWEFQSPIREDNTFTLENVPSGVTDLIFWLRHQQSGMITKRAALRNVTVQEGGIQFLGEIYLSDLW